MRTYILRELLDVEAVLDFQFQKQDGISDGFFQSNNNESSIFRVGLTFSPPSCSSSTTVALSAPVTGSTSALVTLLLVVATVCDAYTHDL